MELLRARVLLPDGTVVERTIAMDGRRIIGVRAPLDGDPDCLAGLVVPGLVNAHTHLELSWPPLIPGGEGFVAWGRRLFELRKDAPAAERRAALAAEAAVGLREAGVAAICDVCTETSTMGILHDAGLSGMVQRELLGFGAAVRDWQVTRAPDLFDEFVSDDVSIRQRPCPHAPYSTPDAIVRACLVPGHGPASIHLAEDEAEDRFLVDGSGPFAQFLDELQIDWGWWSPPGLRSVPWLHSLGGLRGDTLVVHAVHTTEEDWLLLASTATPVCLCIRSNLHIGGLGPPLAGLVDAGVPLCLGTDSLASCPDLDVLAEIPALVAAAPEVPVVRWLLAATRGGADALGLPHLGRIAVGASPGLLQLDIEDADDLRSGPPTRRWLRLPANLPGAP